MTRKRSLQQVKKILLGRRDALRQSLGGELRRFTISDERIVGDDADLAVESDYGTINSQLAETESRELERIEYALEQIELGRYGECEGCGKRISALRLQALPYATTCVKCQRAAEVAGERSAGRSDWPLLPDDDSGPSFLPMGVISPT